MIYYSKSNLKLMINNVVALDVDDVKEDESKVLETSSEIRVESPTIYVSKDVFEQALMLLNTYEGELELLSREFDCEDSEIVYFFFYNAPEPLHMLAPFLSLVDKKIEIGKNIEECCAVLHELSLSIDFKKFVMCPKDIRKDIVVTRRMIKQAKESWDALIVKLNVAEIDMDKITGDFLRELVGILSSAMPSAVVSQNLIESDIVDTSSDKVEELDEDFDIFEQLDKMFKEADEKEGQESKNQRVTEEVIEKEVVTEVDSNKVEERNVVNTIFATYGK